MSEALILVTQVPQLLYISGK